VTIDWILLTSFPAEYYEKSRTLTLITFTIRRSRSVVSSHVQNCNIHGDKVESSPLDKSKTRSSVEIVNGAILRFVVNSLYIARSVNALVM
jgi:hypothetical protein